MASSNRNGRWWRASAAVVRTASTAVRCSGAAAGRLLQLVKPGSAPDAEIFDEQFEDGDAKDEDEFRQLLDLVAPAPKSEQAVDDEGGRDADGGFDEPLRQVRELERPPGHERGKHEPAEGRPEALLVQRERASAARLPAKQNGDA